MATPGARALAEGMPPSKQQQHEEALAPLDDQERRAVQKRLMRRSHGSGASATTRSTARDRYADPSGGLSAGRRSAYEGFTISSRAAPRRRPCRTDLGSW